MNGLAICSEDMVTINHSESWRAKKQLEVVYAARVGKRKLLLGEGHRISKELCALEGTDRRPMLPWG